MSVTTGASAGDTLLELSQVAKVWRGGAALDGVDLAVPRGAIVGLVGPSGAGKTTAMRVGLGLLRPDRGSARLFGDPAGELWRHGGRVGVLLDGAAVEPGLSVRDNLALHARRAGRSPPDVAPLLKRLGLAPLADRRAGRLSQGEAIRVAIARALLLAPDLLVLDEPVAHLDPALAHLALDLLAEAARERGAGVLVSSHQLDELERVATHLVLLHRGRVLLAGALPELLATIAPALRIAAAPRERAGAALAGHSLVARVDALRQDGVELLRVELAPPPAGAPRVDLAAAASALNGALHAAGLSASLIAPERPTLAELFDRTLARAGAAGEKAA